MNDKTRAAIDFYGHARSAVVAAGYEREIRWQNTLSFDDFQETDLLRESAWVILCSGFREQTVREVFNYLSLCFCDWESSSAIASAAEVCRSTALRAFKNPRKIEAIISVARYVQNCSFSELKQRICANPIQELDQLPYVGPITSWHLAKNLGLNVAKHDRHLARISTRFGFSDAQSLCQTVSLKTGDRVNVVDLVLWRYAVLLTANRGIPISMTTAMHSVVVEPS